MDTGKGPPLPLPPWSALAAEATSVLSPPTLMAASVEHPATLLQHPAMPAPLLRLPASASVELAAAVAAAAAAAACAKSDIDRKQKVIQNQRIMEFRSRLLLNRGSEARVGWSR